MKLITFENAQWIITSEDTAHTLVKRTDGGDYVSLYRKVRPITGTRESLLRDLPKHWEENDRWDWLLDSIMRDSKYADANIEFCVDLWERRVQMDWIRQTGDDPLVVIEDNSGILMIPTSSFVCRLDRCNGRWMAVDVVSGTAVAEHVSCKAAVIEGGETWLRARARNRARVVIEQYYHAWRNAQAVGKGGGGAPEL